MSKKSPKPQPPVVSEVLNAHGTLATYRRANLMEPDPVDVSDRAVLMEKARADRAAVSSATLEGVFAGEGIRTTASAYAVEDEHTGALLGLSVTSFREALRDYANSTRGALYPTGGANWADNASAGQCYGGVRLAMREV